MDSFTKFIEGFNIKSLNDEVTKLENQGYKVVSFHPVGEPKYGKIVVMLQKY